MTFPLTSSLASVSRTVSFFLLLSLAWSFYYLQIYQNMYENVIKMKTHFQSNLQKRYYIDSQPIEEDTYLPEQKARVEHLQKACVDPEVISQTIYPPRESPRHRYSTTYNISYCKVPKVGSTFWSQVFLILDNRSVDSVINMPRLLIHRSKSKTLTNISGGQLPNSRVLLPTRDPYSRLYSGYIDKIYLSNKSSLRKSIGTQNSMTGCNNFNVSFEQFLTYIVQRGRSNMVLDNHWAPIYSLCSPCEFEPYRIIKQETFSKDVDIALKEINIETTKYQVIQDILHDHRAEATIPGIVQTLYEKTRNQDDVLECIGMSGVAKRLWISFQIQGFINEHIEFPSDAFEDENDFANDTKLSNIILETVKMYPLSSETRKSQRFQALVSAFRTIKQETIEGVRDLYGPDFHLFNYDKNPPGWTDL